MMPSDLQTQYRKTEQFIKRCVRNGHTNKYILQALEDSGFGMKQLLSKVEIENCIEEVKKELLLKEWKKL